MSQVTVENVLQTWVKEFYDTDGDSLDSIRILFDGYREDDNGNEDESQRCYAVFVHKDSLEEDFTFPEQESFGNLVVHQPQEQGVYYVWTDAEGNLDCYEGPVTDLDPNLIDNIVVTLEERWNS